MQRIDMATERRNHAKENQDLAVPNPWTPNAVK
jgi:hypothetical protein